MWLPELLDGLALEHDKEDRLDADCNDQVSGNPEEDAQNSAIECAVVEGNESELE